MNTSEIITITLLFHLSGFRTFKHFYIYYVQKHMTQDFPKLFPHCAKSADFAPVQ